MNVEHVKWRKYDGRGGGEIPLSGDGTNGGSSQRVALIDESKVVHTHLRSNSDTALPPQSPGFLPFPPQKL